MKFIYNLPIVIAIIVLLAMTLDFLSPMIAIILLVIGFTGFIALAIVKSARDNYSNMKDPEPDCKICGGTGHWSVDEFWDERCSCTLKNNRDKSDSIEYIKQHGLD